MTIQTNAGRAVDGGRSLRAQLILLLLIIVCGMLAIMLRTPVAASPIAPDDPEIAADPDTGMTGRRMSHASVYGDTALLAAPAARHLHGEVALLDQARNAVIADFHGDVPRGLFGHSAAMYDMNGDGILDVLIAAPRVHGGKVYMFLGPHDASNTIEHADLVLSSAMANEDFDFGWRVGPLYDVTGDGWAEIRVMSRLVDEHGRLLQTLQIFSGRTGRLVASEKYPDPPVGLDPWQQIVGDLDHDGIVSRQDIHLLIDHITRFGHPPHVASDHLPRNSDLDMNRVIDALDLTLALAQLGEASLSIARSRNGRVIQLEPRRDRPLASDGGSSSGFSCPSCPGEKCVECDVPCRSNCCGYEEGNECNEILCPDYYDCRKCKCDELSNTCCECGDCDYIFCPWNCDPCPDPPCDPPKSCSWLSLVMDFNNNDGFSIPSDDYDKEDEIDPTEPPGKIVFTNIGDSDNDGIPDYADGYGHTDVGPGGQMTAAQFTPLQLLIHHEIEPEDVEDYTLTFSYQVSDPQDVEVTEHGESPYTWREYELPTQGFFRLWTKDGTAMRSALPIDDKEEPGDFIAKGVAYPLADVPSILYVETVRPGQASGTLDMAVSLVNMKIYKGCRTELVLTSVEVRVHDLQGWEPIWDSQSETVHLNNTDLHSSRDLHRVGGAITDGSSACLLRMTPHIGELPPPLWDMTVQVAKRGAPTVYQPRVVGTLSPPSSTSPLPMPLPTPWEDVAGDEGPSTVNFGAGLAFYVPPDNYFDPDHNPGSNAVLNNEETCDIEFSFMLNGERIGATPFVLRRPPLVLVHGLYSSPETWDKSIWHGLQLDPDDEPLPSPLKTRVYPLDYASTHAMGYDDNWAWVPWTIQLVLYHYRSSIDFEEFHPTHSFRNVRYAANRADVVGHSMGGLLIRVYMSNLEIQNYAREKKNFWGNWVPYPTLHALKINVSRVPQPVAYLATPPSNEFGNDSGKWHFLRHQNYGAGDIRRFVSIGTPFNGSPLADIGREAEVARLQGEGWLARGVREFKKLGDQPGQLDYPPEFNVDHALIDLGEDSTFQRLLEQASYSPHLWKRHWHPIVGIAASIPAESWQNVWWNGIFSNVKSSTLQVFNAGQSDLVVHQDSQANSRMFAASVFGDTVHSPNTIIQQNFNNLPETESAPIAERVLELLSTYDSSHWQGDLGQ